MSLESHKSCIESFVDNDCYPCKYPQPDKEPLGFVYCIEHRLNGKRYIGSTSDFDRRVSEYIRNSQKSSSTLSRPIDKTIAEEGSWAFKMYKVCACYSDEDLAQMEYAYIKCWDTLEPKGYNSTTLTVTLRGNKVYSYPTGILPDAENRRKRSRPVVAVNPDTLVVYFSDSLKLLATEVFHCNRAILSHAAARNQKSYGFYLFYLDAVSSDNAVKQMVAKYERNYGKRSGCREGRDVEYAQLANAIISDGVFYFIDNLYQIFILNYTDDGARFELNEWKYPIGPQEPEE